MLRKDLGEMESEERNIGPLLDENGNGSIEEECSGDQIVLNELKISCQAYYRRLNELREIHEI